MKSRTASQFFKSNEEKQVSLNPLAKESHVVGMTQYYVCNFDDPESPDYVSTYDITSCVILLLKNIDPLTKKCAHFGMAHINLSNIFFPDQAINNLNSFITSFTDAGGKLSKASIQLIGGLEKDPNGVREKIKVAITSIAKVQSIQGVVIKEPAGHKLNTDTESVKKGNSEVMTLLCDNEGTYTRKAIFQQGKKLLPIFNCLKAETLLGDKELRKFVLVDRAVYVGLKSKTGKFLDSLNAFINSEFKDNAAMQTEKKRLEGSCALDSTEFERLQPKSGDNAEVSHCQFYMK